ncbi:MAG: hypothetical protein LBN00_06320 [Oscillospiraceae bacterium]|jgi:hypothetical protein|nr:hypothetical protein [Oscillospiraceae bacterium]
MKPEELQEYIKALYIAIDEEASAMQIVMMTMATAPREKMPKLIEIFMDENDHIKIYTDLLIEALTGVLAAAPEEAFSPTN